jgi:hypothetical protein
MKNIKGNWEQNGANGVHCGSECVAVSQGPTDEIMVERSKAIAKLPDIASFFRTNIVELESMNEEDLTQFEKRILKRMKEFME